MTNNRYDVIQISRDVLKDDARLAFRARHYCESFVMPDYSEGVMLPIYSENGEKESEGLHRMVGKNLFKVTDNLVMPLYRLDKPAIEGYRPAFVRASEKFDDGSRTVVAQVTDRITKKDLEFDMPIQDKISVTTSEMSLYFTENGFEISAVVDAPEQFIEEHKLVVQFMDFIGKMRKFKKNMAPDENYIPRIPLVHFALEAKLDSINIVFDKLSEEIYNNPARFTLGQVLPPKIY